MALERERRFLIKDLIAMFLQVEEKEEIVQWYLSTKPSIRVRWLPGEDRYILTSKRRVSKDSSNEVEIDLPSDDAAELITNALGKVSKVRLTLPQGWEVDVFTGDNAGLIIAEIELDEDEDPILPDWVGREITGVRKYANSQLAIKPFTKWKVGK